MVMDKKLNKIIFRKLYEDLSGVEIIQHNGSIWFIDRDNKYWYLEYLKDGTLYWRYPFFNTFFQLFSIEMDEYEQVIIDWVEQVLNCKVVTPNSFSISLNRRVEQVLNCKVVTPSSYKAYTTGVVEEVLNCKVVTPTIARGSYDFLVGEVLNCKVVTPQFNINADLMAVEEVLNCKVVTSQ